MKHHSPTFAGLAGVHPKTAAALERIGISRPFPVQSAVVPLGIRGRDLLVQSPTGSGKTLAFGIPIVEQLKAGTKAPTAVVLVPTRELAQQVSDDLYPLAKGKGMDVCAVFGGAAIDRQAQRASRAAIVVATPGRLDDLLRQRRIDLRAVRILVLDEADRMLDMGFQPQVDAIAEKLPQRKQVLLFSATLEGAVAKVAATYTHNAETITNGVAPGAGGEIQHVMMSTTSATKIDSVLDALDDDGRDLAVVFVRTKRGADRLNLRLRDHGLRATAIHGGMTQGQRTREYGRFQRGACDVLVATDVFARGMDLDRITHVVNYDIPEDADTYRHRAGRTGRAGRAGVAITMVAPNQKSQMRQFLREADLDPSLLDRMRKPSGRRYQPSPAPVVEEQRERGGRRAERSAAPAAAGPGDGSVASYDPLKGFGFITPDRGHADVFFHRKAIRGCEPARVQRGMRVTFSAERGERGERASEVHVLSGSARHAGPQRGAAKPAFQHRGAKSGYPRTGGNKPGKKFAGRSQKKPRAARA